MPPRLHFLGRPPPRMPAHTRPSLLRLRVPGQRHASSGSLPIGTRLKRIAIGLGLGASVGLGYIYVTDTRASVHKWLAVPVIRWLHPDAEDAHAAGTRTLRTLWDLGLHPRERGGFDDGGNLSIEVFGQTLLNPIGTSAGIDKNAEIPSPLLALGPAVVEVGGVTPHPQDGNPLPRVFRLPSQKGLINRYGLNSEGADAVAMRLQQRVREFAYAHGYGLDAAAEQAVLDGAAGVPPGSLQQGRLLAVQVAKNKTTPDADIAAVRDDYVYCVDALGKYADIVVVNVSSPNTPGLRDMQRVAPLTAILTGVVEAAARAERRGRPTVMVKVSPDEDSDEQVMGVCAAVLQAGVDGVIVGNTTTRRPDPVAGSILSASEKQLVLEKGGYSGPQLFDRTVNLVRKYRDLLDRGTLALDRPRKEIFATGGITNGKQVLEVLNAGASVGMVYTALVYGGVGTISRIKDEMRREIREKLDN